MKLSLSEVKADEATKIYFNWTCNALLPMFPGAADRYFELHRQTIVSMAQHFLAGPNCHPETIYRGIILRQPAARIMPQKYMKYLSFSTDIKIAEHFADVNGFGSDIVDVKKQLGTHGYVIKHSPQPDEILFHHCLFDTLPYVEAFNMIGIKGQQEVDGLKKQKEVMIQQPETPFTNIKPFYHESNMQKAIP